MDLTSAPRFPLHADGRDPHDRAAALRAEGPVVPVELPGGVPAWLVTQQRTGQAVLADDRFVKDIAAWGAWQRGEVPPDWPLALIVTVANMATASGVDHARLRLPVSRAFTARRVAALRPRVAELTAELLDSLGEAGREGPVDLRAHFAYPLPIRVICELLGMPDELGPRVRDLCGRLFVAPAGPEETVANNRALRAALGELVEYRRAHPADDLTSSLVALHDEDTPGEDGTARLSAPELVDTLLLLIVAGHETTVNLLVNAVRALLTHPDQLELLRTGEQPWSAAVEETLRWDPPLADFPFRYALDDVELGGRTVRAGEPVLLGYTSFGRDPEQHGDGADRFDLGRPPTRHLAFGHGIHHCLGAPLARLEAGIALPALFDRYPRLALAAGGPPPEPLPTLVFNGLVRLPVELT